jgi:hypothetical protein
MDGRCIHVAFIMSGLAKMQDKLIGYTNDSRELSKKEIFQVYGEGYLFWDFIKIFSHKLKICSHWMSHLQFSDKILEYYKDDISNYFSKVDGYIKWFNEGCRKENCNLKPFNEDVSRYKNIQIKEVSDEYLSYESCVTCSFFRYTQDKNGIVEPFKGICLNQGKYGLDSKSTIYTFLGCSQHKKYNSFVDKVAYELPKKLCYYVETNIIEDDIDKIKYIYSFPLITQNNKIEISKSVKDVDMTKLLRNTYNIKNWNNFNKLEEFKPIQEFFRNGLKNSCDEEIYTDFEI